MPNNMSPNDLVEKQIKELECLSDADRDVIDSMVLSFALRLMPLHRDLRRIIARQLLEGVQLQDSDEQ